jgi:predicted RNA-binding protein with PIN domain
MLYLIDGYNLLHAMGALSGPVGPQGLFKARLRLLGLLSGVLGTEAASVTVVFDAAAAPPDVLDDQQYQGIHVRFAVHQEQADDLIESLIRECSAPKQLAVVSDDRRIQKAAERRNCSVIGCLDFLEELARHRRRNRLSQGNISQKKAFAAPNKKELDIWLQEFAHLDDEKEMKELFRPFDFGQPDTDAST